MYFGFCVRKVSRIPFQKSSRNSRRKMEFMLLVCRQCARMSREARNPLPHFSDSIGTGGGNLYDTFPTALLASRVSSDALLASQKEPIEIAKLGCSESAQ